MGQTFIAQDLLLPNSPQCVVKQLKPASKTTEFLEVAKRLFYSEAETLQKLGKHNQIPQLLAYFEQDREFLLVQQYIEGAPLTQELVIGHRWPEPQVRKLLKNILSILTFVYD